MSNLINLVYPKKVYGLVLRDLGYSVCEFDVKDSTIVLKSVSSPNTLLSASNQLAIDTISNVLNNKNQDLKIKGKRTRRKNN